jgi:hypothetical protein
MGRIRRVERWWLLKRSGDTDIRRKNFKLYSQQRRLVIEALFSNNTTTFQPSYQNMPKMFLLKSFTGLELRCQFPHPKWLVAHNSSTCSSTCSYAPRFFPRKLSNFNCFSGSDSQALTYRLANPVPQVSYHRTGQELRVVFCTRYERQTISARR